MNKILLITRPKHDITVRYLFYWAKKIIELAKNKGISILDLKENTVKLASSESTENYLIPFLAWDMRHQVCLGNESVNF